MTKKNKSNNSVFIMDIETSHGVMVSSKQSQNFERLGTDEWKTLFQGDEIDGKEITTFTTGMDFSNGEFRMEPQERRFWKVATPDLTVFEKLGS